MTKSLKIGSILIIVLVIGILIPTVFIREKTELTEAAAKCTNDYPGDREDARIAASQLFNPLESLFILNTIVTGAENNTLYISAYTLFGIEFVRVKVECTDGNVSRALVIKRLVSPTTNER